MAVRLRLSVLLTTALVVVAALLGTAVPVVATGTSGAAVNRPNIVYVLTDDLDSGLLRFMPQVRKLAADGATFSNYSVTDSLCCPSRASIFTGQFPHNTGVHTNDPANGGYWAFRRNGLENVTFAKRLQTAGYRTAMMGKYLNGYETPNVALSGGSRVPAGWDDWLVTGNDGYGQYNYTLNKNGMPERHGHRPSDYHTDVLARNSVRFVKDAANSGKPFMLEVATYSPHAPYRPAPRDAHKFPGLTMPRGPSFDEGDVSDKPGWVRGMPLLSKMDMAQINHDYRRRAQSVLAVDRMLGRLRATLEKTGQADNTYVVFNSDNGFHLGQHRLLTGKKTAFDTDIHVPLVIAGPGVPSGRTISRVAENIDLGPTFTDIGGTSLPTADGRSLLPLLLNRHEGGWKKAALVEHYGPNLNRSDPDYQPTRNANPPTYTAVRTARYTYVEYVTGEHEYYDRKRDPYQLTNSYGSLSTAKRQALRRQLLALHRCRGVVSCNAAGRRSGA